MIARVYFTFDLYLTMPYVILMYYELAPHVVVEAFSFSSILFSQEQHIFLIVTKYLPKLHPEPSLRS